MMKLTKRLEHKYLITYLDYLKIIHAIKATMIHDQHGDNESYLVNSIYLDDIVYTGAADKAFGNQIHKKYRIRHYDDIAKKKLELKFKEGNESSKYSTMISEEIFQAIISQNLDILEQHFDDELIRRYTLDMLKSNLLPRCYITYQREAYKDELDNIRITFDHSLSAERYLGSQEGFDMKLMSDTTMIMEIKYEHYIPSAVKELMKKISLNQIAYSKYYMGYNSLEL